MKHVIEMISILLTVVAFIWEAQKSDTEQRVMLWVLVVSVFVFLIIYITARYAFKKINQIDNNASRIEDIEKHFNIQEQLQTINCKIATLEGISYGKMCK